MEIKPQPPPSQRIVFLIALLLWALVSIPSWIVALLCYVVALLLANSLLVWFPTWLPWQAGTRGHRWLLIALLVAVPTVLVARLIAGMNPAKELAAVRENVADRLALEWTPSISPALLVTHEPQRFLIYAPGTEQVTVRWTPESPVLSAVELGHGVHLLDFDPRTDASLLKPRGDALTCTITTDGVSHQRTMKLVHPQPHPRQLRSVPAAGVAATVSEETDELIIVRRDGSHQRVPVGDGPTDCGMFDDGRRIVVAHRFTPQLWVIDAADGKVLTRFDADSFQTRIAISPDGKQLAVAIDGLERGIRLYLLPELSEPVFLPLDFTPDLLEFGADASELVVTDRRGRAVHRLARERDKKWQIRGVPLRFPRPITALGRTPEAKQLALATTASFLTGEQPQANHFIENTIHTLDMEQFQVVATQLTDRRGLSQDSPGDTEHGISPLALAVIEGHLFAAFAGSNEVAEVPRAGVSTGYLSMDPYPLFAPQGLADLGEGIWCVSSPVDGNIGLFDRDAMLQKLIHLADKGEDLAKSDPAATMRRRGERTFYEGTRAGISCQSCHLDSTTDYCLHDIGQGKPVNVLSVRGIIGTSPYLRDASHWRLRDLHEVAALGYRDHQRSVSWDRADAVAAYLDSLPPVMHARAHSPFDTFRMRSGVEAFFKADCAVCHTPPALTNLGQQSALSLFPDYYGESSPAAGTDAFLDTPSLRGIALTPPYLHDGRAASLRSVLTDWNRGGRHGNTQRLSPEEIDDLLYFLERM